MSFDLARFETERRQRNLWLGQPVSWRDVTASTNDDALQAARNGAPQGALFGSEAQTSGRGRRGSHWFSEPGAGLWFSLLLKPKLSAELAPGLSLCAGLAVRDAVASRTSARVQVKWPNDVLAGGLKIAGVLIESQVSGHTLGSVVIGIGLNLEQRAFPDELAGIATSLLLSGATERAREPLLADLLGGFESRLERLEARGVAGLSDELRRYDALLGRRLRVGEHEGIGAGVDETGRLLLQTPSGATEAVASGHVTLINS